MTGKIPWEDLEQDQKEQFAALCDEFVGIETVEDAKKYYGNKEQLLQDAREATK
jgi:hypothetical protein